MSDVSDPNHDVERIDPQSLDVAEQKRQELLRLFPEVRTEGAKVDFDRLKLTLGATVDVGKERYGLTWPGKAECFRTIQRPSTATLRPIRDESVTFDTTETLIIEGDNLEALKLLQKAYLGKVKMLYIDPPYNTGNDFIYPDNYTESLQTYLEYTGQVDAGGKRFSTNAETDGRFHSKWLNMMYPRLFLARNLLSDDGLIFISINETELAGLRKICDEVFGDEHFRGQVTRNTGTPTGQGNDILVNEVDYILIYSRATDAALSGLDFDSEDEAIYDQKDESGRYLIRPLRKTGGADRREDRPTMYYKITDPDGGEVWPIGPGGYESRWRCAPARFAELAKNNLIEWRKVDDGPFKWRPYQKFYLEGRKKQPSNLWTDVEGNKKASIDLKNLFDGEKVFDFPKPVGLISKCVSIGSGSDGLILDFFAGSGVTAEAVMRLNENDGGQRRFILVQLPEHTGRTDYKTISMITRERTRRAAKALASAGPAKLGLGAAPDRGFRAFALAESNLLAWNGDTGAQTKELEQQLALHVHHLRPGRTDDDLLFEILLKEGFALTTRIETVKIATEEAKSLAEGALIICLSRKLNVEAVREIASRGPERVVCLDEGFAGDDQLKTNAAQIFKAKGIVFRTV
jgi:adenine-specific DNA-methyltransferase